MGQKICCGGFELGEGLELNGKTLSATGGGSMPDPTQYEDGTVLVKVGNEWKPQSGYGWETDPIFPAIVFDDSIEGKAVALANFEGETYSYYCAREGNFSISDLIGSTISMQEEQEPIQITADMITPLDENNFYIEGLIYAFNSFPIVFDEATINGTIAGLYYSIDIIESTGEMILSAPTTVTKINQKYIQEPNLESVKPIIFYCNSVFGSFINNNEKQRFIDFISSNPTVEQLSRLYVGYNSDGSFGSPTEIYKFQTFSGENAYFSKFYTYALSPYGARFTPITVEINKYSGEMGGTYGGGGIDSSLEYTLPIKSDSDPITFAEFKQLIDVLKESNIIGY